VRLYKLVATRNLRFRLDDDPRTVPLPGNEDLERLVAGAVVQSIVASTAGNAEIAVRYELGDRDCGVAAMEAALAELGFHLVRAEIEEWAKRTTEGLIGGALLGGAGGSASHSGTIALLAAVAGALAGAFAGSFVTQLTNTFVAQRRGGASWEVVEVRPPPAAVDLAPGN
jgi:hypothetical protein